MYILLCSAHPVIENPIVIEFMSVTFSTCSKLNIIIILFIVLDVSVSDLRRANKMFGDNIHSRTYMIIPVPPK